MKKILLLVICLLVFGAARGQNINADSLIKLVASIKDEATDHPSSPDSILKTLFFIKSPAGRIKAVYDIIELNGEMKFDRALYYYHKILEEAKKRHDAVVESVITGELGYSLAFNGDYTEGFKMMLQALALAERTGNKQAIGTVYDNLGVSYEGDPKISIGYYKKALQYSIAGGDYLFGTTELSNIGGTFSGIHQPDSANYYLIKAINLAVQKKQAVIAQFALVHFGNMQPDQKTKIRVLKATLRMSYSERDASHKGGILASIAVAYKKLGVRDSALYYARWGYTVAYNVYLARKVGTASVLAYVYKGVNADSALKYTEIYYQWRDSLVNIDKAQRAQNMAFAEQQRQQQLAAEKAAYQTTIRLYLLVAVIAFLLILAFVFWRNNRHKQKANLLLSEQKEEIETQRDELGRALDELKITQTQLIQSEKMASLGELTAGIAHEIQNPLNFVNNFSEVNEEMFEELKAALISGDTAEALSIANDLQENEKKIRHHGKRADFIVKGMLEHSRKSSGEKQPTNMNVLCDEFLKLSFHGLRARDKSFNAEMVTHFDPNLPSVNVSQQDIGRVMLNLFNNAFYAVNEKAKTFGADFKPTVEVSTSATGGEVIITVRDNGNGIPDAIKDKIMQPFFTTKPTGEGTGLGLSLSYDIVVKGHGGAITIDTKEEAFTAFKVTLPG